MLKKTAYDQSPATDGWDSFDPVDGEVMDRLFTKGIRERKEKVMLAVLENAIEYFQKYVLATDETGKELFREAEEWILEKNNDWLYSFENICEVLGLHPDYMRQGLMSWKEAKCEGRSIQPHRAGRAKLTKTRVHHTSVRRSKAA